MSESSRWRLSCSFLPPFTKCVDCKTISVRFMKWEIDEDKVPMLESSRVYTARYPLNETKKKLLALQHKQLLLLSFFFLDKLLMMLLTQITRKVGVERKSVFEFLPKTLSNLPLACSKLFLLALKLNCCTPNGGALENRDNWIRAVIDFNYVI